MIVVMSSRKRDWKKCLNIASRSGKFVLCENLIIFLHLLCDFIKAWCFLGILSTSFNNGLHRQLVF